MRDLIDESKKQNRIEMIRKALQQKTPQTYKELEESGNLQQFLEGHDAEMMLSYNEAKNRALEDTMSRFIDFFDPIYDETSSPM